MEKELFDEMDFANSLFAIMRSKGIMEFDMFDLDNFIKDQFKSEDIKKIFPNVDSENVVLLGSALVTKMGDVIDSIYKTRPIVHLSVRGEDIGELIYTDTVKIDTLNSMVDVYKEKDKNQNNKLKVKKLK